METITIIYLILIFASLYVSFLFLILFVKNRQDMFKDKISKNLPLLSIIIPAYNEEKTIAKTIAAVKNSNYPKNKLEIIAVNDGSTDNTLDVLKKINGIKIISKKNTGKADSMNQGIKQTKGNFIAIIDADSYIEKDALQKMMDYFRDEKVGAVTGAILVRKQGKLIEKLQAIEYTIIAWTRKLMEFVGSVFATPGPLSIYRKKVLKKIGGFDTKAWTEDIDITWNILKHGYKTKMCLSAQTYTTVPNSLRKWWKQRNRWNAGGLQLVGKYKDTFLRKKYGQLGYFIWPFFTSFYILSLMGFSVYVFLLIRAFLRSSLTIKYAYLTKLPILKAFSFIFAPTVFTFFIAALFILSLIYALFAFKTISQRNKIDLKYGYYLFMYLLFYLLLNPVVLVHSIYRVVTGNMAW